MKSLIVILAAMISVQANAESREFPIEKGQFELKTGSGNVVITGHDEPKMVVNYVKTSWKDSCKLEFENTEDTVKIKVADESSWSFFKSCRVDFRILMPNQVNTEIKAGSSDVTVESYKGEFAFRMGSGDVAVSDSHLKRVDGRAGSGDISLKGIFDSVDLKVGSGDISARFLDLSKASTFSAKAGSGDVAILVPGAKSVSVDYKSGSGDLKNNVTSSENPDLKVSVRTGSGDLKVEQL